MGTKKFKGLQGGLGGRGGRHPLPDTGYGGPAWGDPSVQSRVGMEAITQEITARPKRQNYLSDIVHGTDRRFQNTEELEQAFKYQETHCFVLLDNCNRGKFLSSGAQAPGPFASAATRGYLLKAAFLPRPRPPLSPPTPPYPPAPPVDILFSRFQMLLHSLFGGHTSSPWPLLWGLS